MSILFLYCFYALLTDYRLKICQSSLPSPFFLPVIPFAKEPVLVFNDQSQILIMRDDWGRINCFQTTLRLFSYNFYTVFAFLHPILMYMRAFALMVLALGSMGIVHSHNTPFCPRASGEVEQISSWRKKWRAELNNFLLSYRSANQTTTGRKGKGSPFSLPPYSLSPTPFDAC